MNEIAYPIAEKATLIKSVVIAVILAIIVYGVIILPAEFNRDPTGVGNLLGLTVLSEEKASANTAIVDSKEILLQDDLIELEVPPGKGIEYKFELSQYQKLTFEWSTDGARLYFDFHGEPEGDTTGFFESYTIATSSFMKGTITVPFNGVHGWYWKNKTNQTIKVTLKTQGNYTIVGLIQ